MTDSRKFVLAADSVNISMMAINRLYDQQIVSDQDYQAASIMFFAATRYIMEWNDNITAGIAKPELRNQVIEMARQLAIRALGPADDDSTEMPNTAPKDGGDV